MRFLLIVFRRVTIAAWVYFQEHQKTRQVFCRLRSSAQVRAEATEQFKQGASHYSHSRSLMKEQILSPNEKTNSCRNDSFHVPG